MKPEIYDHFHRDERDFVDRAWEWVENAAQYHETKLTDFMDPRQRFILETLVNRHPDVHAAYSGGHPDAERVRGLIAPDYKELADEDMGLQVLSVTSGDQKFLSLEHGDYMGAILGLGIKRSKIGDIHVLDDGCHAVVSNDIGAYLHMNLSQVHRVHVMTELLPIESLRIQNIQLDMMELTAASLRLDGIASDVHRISRAKIVIPIKAGRCRVNWKVEEDPSAMLHEGDIVSIQGLGRFKVLEIGGLTKKGRYRVKAGKFA